MTYRAPVQDILFAMKASGGLDQLIESGVFGEVDEDLIGAVLEEAGKFASDVLAPLNQTGDQTGSHLVDGKVVVPDGWTEAYTAWAEGEWGALPCSPDYAQCAFRANKNMFEVKAGIVLFELAQTIPDGTICEHDFEAQSEGACSAIGEHRNATGIGGEIAANLAGTFGGEA